MKTLKYAAIGTVLAGMTLTPAFGASAKFAAHALDLNLISTTSDNLNLVGANAVPEDAVILNGMIKTANKKDLLIGVSLEIGLYTETQVKGKNGSKESAGAEGGVKITVKVDGEVVPPGQVTFAQRFQELSATLGGVIESCNVVDEDTDGDGENDSSSINVERDCVVSDEEIGLIISTMAAHHFNFILPDLSPGEHHVEVIADVMSHAEYTNGTYDVYNDDGTVTTVSTTDNVADAWALVGKGSMAVQEVQAVNIKGGSDGDVIELY